MKVPVVATASIGRAIWECLAYAGNHVFRGATYGLVSPHGRRILTQHPVHTRWYLAGAVDFTTEGGKPNVWPTHIVKGIPLARRVRRGYAVTAHPCIPARVINDIGPFDARRYSGVDADFCRRTITDGDQLAYLPEAVVHHPARDSWHALLTKARRVWGEHSRHTASGSETPQCVYRFAPP